MPLAYAKLLLRGEPGSTVDLSVLRRKPEPQKLTLTRAIITNPPVESRMLPDSLGYVKVSTLGSGKVKEVSTALADLQKQGAKKIILDLRSCAVGDPEDGAALANLFVGKGLITYAMGQKFPRKDYNADEKNVVSTLPLVVMTNRATASAAEVAASGLQTSKRAALVGEADLWRCIDPESHHDGRRRSGHSLRCKVLLNRWEIDSGQWCDARESGQRSRCGNRRSGRGRRSSRGFRH